MIGFASGGAASQHTGRCGLACLNERDSCCARNAYATGLFCYSPKRYTRARPQRGSQTMGLAELVLLAIGLSMDAFAVSICKGLGMKKINLKAAVVLGLFFGGFQAGMPVIGWALGSQFMGIIGPIDTGSPLSFWPSSAAKCCGRPLPRTRMKRRQGCRKD